MDVNSKDMLDLSFSVSSSACTPTFSDTVQNVKVVSVTPSLKMELVTWNQDLVSTSIKSYTTKHKHHLYLFYKDVRSQTSKKTS